MDWQYGFTASYHAAYVDPNTWRDIERFEIIDGTISREESSLMESADLTCRNFDTTRERWVRIYLDARQSGYGERVALFTGLATSPTVNVSGTVTEYPVQMYSVLKPAEVVLLDRGWYAPTEISGSKLVKGLLSVCPGPVSEEPNAPTLNEAIVAEDGESNLTMIGKILTAIGWRLRIGGDGSVVICPKATEPAKTFSALMYDTIEPEIELEQDWYECPNVFRAVNDEQGGVARDDSDASPLSTVNRGREVWMEETSCDFIDGESIAEYAIRRLKEEQSYYINVSYDRRYEPDILVGDLVQLHYPAQGVDGIYRVKAQTIELGYGARTAEEVVYGDN